MDHLKDLLKSVFSKIGDKKEKPYPSVRMSDLNVSITSNITIPLHSSTFKLTPKTERYKTQEETVALKVADKVKAHNEELAGTDLVKPNDNMIKSINHHSSLSDHKEENRNKLPKLKIVNRYEQKIKPVPNGLSNLSDDMTLSNSMKTNACTPNKQNKPIMGRIALLKKANVEKNDSMIVHELITNKYNSILCYHYNRMYQRRRSRMDSSEDEYSETVFSSPPNSSPVSYDSPASYSSIDFVPDERRFSFPRARREQRDLRFLKSTDDVNIDTTAEDLDTSSLNSSAISNDKSTTSFSEYDPKKFLRNAVGEVTDVSSESGIDNDEATTNRKTGNSDSSYDVSSFLSKANGLYNSIRKSMKKNSARLRTHHQDGDPTKSNRQSVVSSGNSLLENLMRELSIQNEILFQISKAISYCKTMKGFEAAVEFIEAEKILLVASCTKDALAKEIENIDDDTYEPKDDPRSCGQVHLSNFKFYPKDDFKPNSTGDLTENFVMTLTCGSTVLASDVTVADNNGILNIEKNFEFQKLPTDFEISICIYAMKVRQKTHHSQEHNCPSPKKYFLNRTSKRHKVLRESLYIKPSSFLLCGKCEIRSPDLSKINTGTDSSQSTNLKMYNIPLSSSLSGMVSLNLRSSVKLNNKLSGFLTVGSDNEHGCIMWNVRWCLLEGAILKYWNHPSEEGATALGTIDLNNCLEQQISSVDRSLCARPKTLMVPVRYKEGEKKYLLSADNLTSMKEWEKEINYVLRALNMWNCGGVKIS